VNDQCEGQVAMPFLSAFEAAVKAAAAAADQQRERDAEKLKSLDNLAAHPGTPGEGEAAKAGADRIRAKWHNAESHKAKLGSKRTREQIAAEAAARREKARKERNRKRAIRDRKHADVLRKRANRRAEIDQRKADRAQKAQTRKLAREAVKAEKAAAKALHDSPEQVWLRHREKKHNVLQCSQCWAHKKLTGSFWV
jgi:hypothetical protein